MMKRIFWVSVNMVIIGMLFTSCSSSGGGNSTSDSGATLVSIAVTPPNPSIAKGATQQFTATGRFSDSTTQDLTATATWTSLDTTKAMINSSGLSTAISAGTTTITATSGGIVGTNTLTINNATGSVTGTLKVSNLVLPASASVKSSSNSTQADIVPGEIIVRFKTGVNESTAISAILNKYKNVGMINIGPIYPHGPYLLRTSAYRNNNISADEAKRQTQDEILKLIAEPDVQYAEPNGIAKSQLTPNNPAYLAGFQWDMSMINLPTAWEMTTGSTSVIVAVLDSGIRSHPNLAPNVLSTGYNFVEMNSDPTEPLAPNAEFHGTHVAGTIAAVGNTGSGIAGVAWNVKIMPVRVLGEAFGGTDTMIINGMLYAAGLPNSSGKIPPQRANVINMSLAGANSCSATYQDVINQVINAGVTIVAAAGNDAQNGNPIESPASCQGVIAVGAVDPVGAKASYSGSQPYVFIAAPGGEIGEGIHAGVLSTLPISTANGPYYKFMQGTSMATPHISGVVALMYSVNASLTTTQIKNILASTANPLGTTVPNSNVGYGLVDAGKAVAVAKSVSIPAVPVPYPNPSLVNFEQISTAMTFTDNIISMGLGTLIISGGTITVFNPSGGNWLSASLGSSCSAIAPSSYCPLTINVDPAGLPNGQYAGEIILFSNANGAGGVFGIPVAFQVGATPTQTISGLVTVQLWNFDPTTNDFTNLVATTTTDASQNYNYTFQSVPVGNNYVIVAGVDANGDGVFGDYSGEVLTISDIQQITVLDGQVTTANTLEIRNELDDIVNSI